MSKSPRRDDGASSSTMGPGSRYAPVHEGRPAERSSLDLRDERRGGFQAPPRRRGGQSGSTADRSS